MPERGLFVALRQPGPIPLDVEFACDVGDVLVLFGPSGAGKTTILRSIAGLYRPEQATVRCGDQTWTDTATGTFVAAHRRAVGFVFQEYALFPHLTAAGNVIAALSHRPRSERRERAQALLNLVHLSDKARRRPNELSGGERQRVALARALAREPAVLLLDEPFAAVDRRTRRTLQKELAGLRRHVEIPLVLVTHDFDDVVRLASHVVMLEQGTCVAAGPVTSLMSRPDLTWLRDAVGLGTVFHATVGEAFPERRLVELLCDGGTLLATDHRLTKGSRVRVRIPAREVILSTREPEGLSLHNCLSGEVSSLHADPASDYVIVQVAVGRLLLLAEVTRDAVDRLHIVIGSRLHALIKSVSIDVFTGASTIDG